MNTQASRLGYTLRINRENSNREPVRESSAIQNLERISVWLVNRESDSARDAFECFCMNTETA